MELKEIAERLSANIEGDGSVEIRGIATLEKATQGDLSFLANTKYFRDAKMTSASAIIVGNDCPPLERPLLRHENPYLTFAKAIELFYLPEKQEPGIHPTAWISDKAKIGRGVTVGAFSYIADRTVIHDYVEIRSHCAIREGASIGEKTIIDSGCVIQHNVSIGKRCFIQSNSVIGSDGFGYAKQDDGTWYKIYQAGTVVIEDDVEIGACTAIDRSTLGETRVESGAKLDNLVQVGHACIVGANSMLCSQVGLAGSTKLGKNVILAGQVGSAGHLTLGDGVIATGQTGIPGDVEPGKIISGSPSIDNRDWLRSIAVFSRLPEIQKHIRELEKRVKSLEKALDVARDTKTGEL
jgi:UDP-3-O-[3-hydroxymyristoyl] glucosamine N-acyltransferase